jgi:hypothetical protein
MKRRIRVAKYTGKDRREEPPAVLPDGEETLRDQIDAAWKR